MSNNNDQQSSKRNGGNSERPSEKPAEKPSVSKESVNDQHIPSAKTEVWVSSTYRDLSQFISAPQQPYGSVSWKVPTPCILPSSSPGSRPQIGTSASNFGSDNGLNENSNPSSLSSLMAAQEPHLGESYGPPREQQPLLPPEVCSQGLSEVAPTAESPTFTQGYFPSNPNGMMPTIQHPINWFSTATSAGSFPQGTPEYQHAPVAPDPAVLNPLQELGPSQTSYNWYDNWELPDIPIENSNGEQRSLLDDALEMERCLINSTPAALYPVQIPTGPVETIPSGLIVPNPQVQRATRNRAGVARRRKAERKYKCAYCSADFERPSNLGAHIRTHTGERPFPCEVCHKAFQTASNKSRHKLLHNSPDSRSKFAIRPSAPGSQPPGSGQQQAPGL
jgi:hypothetical protein